MSDMTTEATELELFAMNDYDVYKGVYLPIARNLARHWEREDFSRDRAIDGMKHGADAMAHAYCQMHGDLTSWYDVFSVGDRIQVARSLVDGLIDEFENGYSDPEVWA